MLGNKKALTMRQVWRLREADAPVTMHTAWQEAWPKHKTVAGTLKAVFLREFVFAGFIKFLNSTLNVRVCSSCMALSQGGLLEWLRPRLTLSLCGHRFRLRRRCCLCCW